MNINASIIDQRLVSVVNDIRQEASEELRIRVDFNTPGIALNSGWWAAHPTVDLLIELPARI